MVVVDGVEMVDIQEAARLVHRSPETVRRWVWAGRVSHIKQGNRLLIPRTALVASSSATTTTLASWLERRADVLGSRRSGVSAAELVLQDRAERGRVRAGR